MHHFSTSSFNVAVFLFLLPSVVESSGPELINPCYVGNHDCDTTAQCIPLEGQDFQCQCATGYRGDGRNCYGTETYRTWYLVFIVSWQLAFQSDSGCFVYLTGVPPPHHTETKLKTVEGVASVFKMCTKCPTANSTANKDMQCFKLMHGLSLAQQQVCLSCWKH